jgi:hypothetical protein
VHENRIRRRSAQWPAGESLAGFFVCEDRMPAEVVKFQADDGDRAYVERD